MTLSIRVISKQPPGGRCTLYAGYARVLQTLCEANFAIQYSEEQNAHDNGYPTLLINEQAVQPADGVIIMPEDILAGLQAAGIFVADLHSLRQTLELPLNWMLEQTGQT